MSTAASQATGSGNSARKRHRARDDAIRRKVDLELNRKKPSSRPSQPSSPASRPAAAKSGTVSALRPSAPVTIRQSARVIDAAQLMAARRADALLVVDNQERLCGIITDKDLAFRVVAEGLDVNATKVFEVMTKNVTYASSESPAGDALSTMVAGGFRHLPVLDDEGDVVGVLDITKCLFEAIERVEKVFGASKKLTDALQDAQKEWASGGMNSRLSQEFEQLRQRMLCPDLDSILTAENLMPPELGIKSTVRDAARAMKQLKSTAVLVFEDHAKLTGIFTSKDIVLRVMAVKADPDGTSIIRVMTPHPDTVASTTSIQDALKMMHDNRYLHLPVTDGKRVIGLVDVLKLTYTVLEKLNAGEKGSEGPMWNQFWGTSMDNDHLGSQHGDEIVDDDEHGSHTTGTHLRSPGQQTLIRPSDSASVVSDSMTSLSHAVHHAGYEQEQLFMFKFKDPHTQSVHRIASPINLSILVQLLTDKLGGFTEINQLSYIDDEGDDVQLTSDADLETAVAMAKHSGWKRLLLTINDTRADSPAFPRRHHQDTGSVSSLNRGSLNNSGAFDDAASELYNLRNRSVKGSNSSIPRSITNESIFQPRDAAAEQDSHSATTSNSNSKRTAPSAPSETGRGASPPMLGSAVPRPVSPVGTATPASASPKASSWLERVVQGQESPVVLVGITVAATLSIVGVMTLLGRK
ncbi:hypothetical protein RI367_001725 [Sorochytrium milnesiophthora]